MGIVLHGFVLLNIHGALGTCPTEFGCWDPDACSSRFPRAAALVIPGRAQLHRRSTDDVTVGGGDVADAMKSMSSGVLSRIAIDVDAPFASPFHDHRAARREEGELRYGRRRLLTRDRRRAKD